MAKQIDKAMLKALLKIAQKTRDDYSKYNLDNIHLGNFGKGAYVEATDGKKLLRFYVEHDCKDGCLGRENVEDFVKLSGKGDTVVVKDGKASMDRGYRGTFSVHVATDRLYPNTTKIVSDIDFEKRTNIRLSVEHMLGMMKALNDAGVESFDLSIDKSDDTKASPIAIRIMSMLDNPEDKERLEGIGLVMPIQTD